MCSAWVPVTHASVTPLRGIFQTAADRAARRRFSRGCYTEVKSALIRWNEPLQLLEPVQHHFACQVGQYDPKGVWRDFLPIVDWVANNWNQHESGIWEVRGGLRHFVYGKVMSWVALDRGIKLVEAFGLSGDTARWRANDLGESIHAGGQLQVAAHSCVLLADGDAPSSVRTGFKCEWS